MSYGQRIKPIHNSRSARLMIIVPLILVGLFYFSKAYGIELPQRSLLISDNIAGDTATYMLGFTIPAVETIGSIKLQICANDPLFVDPCVAPAGFSISSSTLANQTGETGFTILPAGTNANTVVLTRTPTVAAAQPVNYTFANVINPSSDGEYYGRLQTFASIDASGPENDHGGLAMSYNEPVQVSVTVPPYLLFCSGVIITGFDCNTASGDYINLGNLSSNYASSAQSQLLTATNAKLGYNINVYGTTMTSGNNIINSIASSDVSRPGTSQFGLNLVANQTPQVGQNPSGPGNANPGPGYNQPNLFQFIPGSTIATVSAPDDFRQFTLSYMVNIPPNQTAGVYVATLNYICLANF